LPFFSRKKKKLLINLLSSELVVVRWSSCIARYLPPCHTSPPPPPSIKQASCSGEVELQELSPPAKIRKSNSGSRRLPAVQNVKSRSSYLWSVVVVPEKSNCFEGEDEQIIEKVVEIEDENIQTIGKLKNVRVEVKAVKFARTALLNKKCYFEKCKVHVCSRYSYLIKT
jgi:hypothetical protein